MVLQTLPSTVVSDFQALALKLRIDTVELQRRCDIYCRYERCDLDQCLEDCQLMPDFLDAENIELMEEEIQERALFTHVVALNISVNTHLEPDIEHEVVEAIATLIIVPEAPLELGRLREPERLHPDEVDDWIRRMAGLADEICCKRDLYVKQ